MKPKKVQFYRWEHKMSKIGPYNHVVGNPLSTRLIKTAQKRNLPTPDKDGYSFAAIDSDALYGFATIAQMNNWFSKADQKAMLKYNFRLAEYRVDKKFLKVLGSQAVAFNLKRAYRILKGK